MGRFRRACLPCPAPLPPPHPRRAQKGVSPRVRRGEGGRACPCRPGDLTRRFAVHARPPPILFPSLLSGYPGSERFFLHYADLIDFGSLCTLLR